MELWAISLTFSIGRLVSTSRRVPDWIPFTENGEGSIDVDGEAVELQQKLARKPWKSR
jgi:hypothetical protein